MSVVDQLDQHREHIESWAAQGKTLQWMADQIAEGKLHRVRDYCLSRGIPYNRKRGWRPGSMRGKDHPRWAGGTRKTGDGYILQYAPWHPFARKGGFVYQHRLVAEQKLGRLLRPGEVVHHIDGDKANNDPENLQVFPSNIEHMRLHLPGREYPQEWRDKLSKARKGKKLRPRSPQHREALSKSLRGKAKSAEHRRKLSEAAKGRKLGPRSPEVIEKVASKLRGQKRTPEQRRRIADGLRRSRARARQSQPQGEAPGTPASHTA